MEASTKSKLPFLAEATFGKNDANPPVSSAAPLAALVPRNCRRLRPRLVFDLSPFRSCIFNPPDVRASVDWTSDARSSAGNEHTYEIIRAAPKFRPCASSGGGTLEISRWCSLPRRNLAPRREPPDSGVRDQVPADAVENFSF